MWILIQKARPRIVAVNRPICHRHGRLTFPILRVDALQAFGSNSGQSQFTMSAATGDCSSYPGVDGLSSGASPSNEAEEVEAGVNFTEDAQETESEVVDIETNDAAGSSGQGDCETVLMINKVDVEHASYSDSSTSVDNLFDADLGTYFSVNRESTSITLELEEETDVNGIAIGFFMKSESEERIQTFDVAVKKGDDDDWKTVISRKESSGKMDMIETYPFSSRTALYVRFESHGNT